MAVEKGQRVNIRHVGDMHCEVDYKPQPPAHHQAVADECQMAIDELENGDKFLFDLGTDSSDNLAALSIAYDYLNKIFLSHLHTDRFGDFGALYVGGLINGRRVQLAGSGFTVQRLQRFNTVYFIEQNP